MPRTMLQVRMDALARQLKEAKARSGYRDRLDLTPFPVDEKLWERAVEEIGRRASAELKVLDKATEQGLSEAEGWKVYAAVQRQSERIFQDWLELLGGLALRSRMTDADICRFADSLIRERADELSRSGAFTIPGRNGTASSTLRRVARFPFPEWNIWTLPLVAHEHAYVVLEEAKVLIESVDELAGELAAPDETKEDATSRVQTMFADAIATYTMGPSYAFAALVLQLDPLARGKRGRPSHQDRVGVILDVLAAMNERSRRDAFLRVLTDLQAYWRVSTEDAVGDAPPPPPPSSPFDVGRFIEAFEEQFIASDAAYSSPEWSRAQEWSRRWTDDLRVPGGALQVPEDLRTERGLTDPLNAAWCCRVEATRELGPGDEETAAERVARIERVTREICADVVGQKPTGRARAAGPGRSQRPRKG